MSSDCAPHQVHEDMRTAGTPIVCVNEQDVKLYVIRRGRATITDDELGEVAELEAGQYFGELALTGRKHRRAAGVIASRHGEGLLLASLSLATVRTNPKLVSWIAALDAIAETEAQKEMAKRGPPKGHVAGAPWPSSKKGVGATPDVSPRELRSTMLKRRSFGELLVEEKRSTMEKATHEAKKAAKQASGAAAAVAGRIGLGGTRRAAKSTSARKMQAKSHATAAVRAAAPAAASAGAPVAAPASRGSSPAATPRTPKAAPAATKGVNAKHAKGKRTPKATSWAPTTAVAATAPMLPVPTGEKARAPPLLERVSRSFERAFNGSMDNLRESSLRLGHALRGDSRRSEHSHRSYRDNSSPSSARDKSEGEESPHRQSTISRLLERVGLSPDRSASRRKDGRVAKEGDGGVTTDGDVPEENANLVC